MRTVEEVAAALAACEARNKELSDQARTQFLLPKAERDPEYDGEDNVRNSRYNNVTMSALKWILGADIDPVWR